MKYQDFKFVLLNLSYIKKLYEIDKEVFFNQNLKYELKPYLGILITNNGREYAIPLTSAKPKHAKWRDVTEDNYRIYEIIDTRIAKIKNNDVIVPITNTSILKVDSCDYIYFKKKILSILEIKKMIPLIENCYKIVDFNLSSSKEELDRNNLMKKEYLFCKKIREKILNKANKIYNYQITFGIIKPFYCNFKLLEQKCMEWEEKHK